MQYWHEDSIPSYMEEHLETFGELNPEIPHVVFSRSTAEEFIGAHFTSREVAAFQSCAVPAMQADYLRYCAIHVLGGVYCDADARCVGSLAPLLETGAGKMFTGSNEVLNNAILVFPKPGHPLPLLAVELATMNVERRLSEKVWVVTGPGVLHVLSWLRETGSFDAFLGLVGDALGPCRDGPAVCEQIGSYDRVAAAWSGVRVGTSTELDAFIRHGLPDLPYRDSGMHFPNFKGSIYA